MHREAPHPQVAPPPGDQQRQQMNGSEAAPRSTVTSMGGSERQELQQRIHAENTATARS